MLQVFKSVLLGNHKLFKGFQVWVQFVGQLHIAIRSHMVESKHICHLICSWKAEFFICLRGDLCGQQKRRFFNTKKYVFLVNLIFYEKCVTNPSLLLLWIFDAKTRTIELNALLALKENLPGANVLWQ